MKKRTYLGLICAALLVGCGGSNNDSPENNNQQQTTTPPTEVKKLTLKTQYLSKCGEAKAATNVQFVVHKQDGSILATHQPDSNGTLSIPWNGEAKHLTTIYDEKYDSTEPRLRIKTEMDLEPIDLGVINIRNNEMDQACDCREIKLDISALKLQYPNQQFAFEQRLPTVLLTQGGNFLNDMEVCRINGEYRSGILKTASWSKNEGVQLAAIVSLKDADTGTVTVPIDVFDAAKNKGTEIKVNANVSDFRVNTYGIDSGKFQNSFSFNTETNNTAAYFPELFTNNLMIISYSHTVGQTLQGEVKYGGGRYIPLEMGKLDYQIQLPEDDIAMMPKVVEMLVGMTSDSPVAYDFSEIGSNPDYIFALLSAPKFWWDITAPVKGVAPDFDLPQSVVQRVSNKFIGKRSFSVRVRNINKVDGLSEYRRKQVDMRKKAKHEQRSLLNDSTYSQIAISLKE
ncbi:MAG: hypothetical protein ACPGUD_01645 [Parashewanella sp.]